MPDALPPILPAFHVPLGARADDASSSAAWDRAGWRGMAATGWFGLRVPRAEGGLGLGPPAVMMLAEACGAALLPAPLVALGLLPATLLQAVPASPLRRRLHAGVLAGDLILPVAWQSRAEQLVPEPTHARLGGSPGAGLVLTGTRRLVPGAEEADGFLVTAERDGRVALAHIPRGQAGVTVMPRHLPDGTTDATLRFERVLLPGEALLAEDIGAALTAALEEATLALAAQLLGVARSALAPPPAAAAAALHLALDLLDGDPVRRAQAVSLAKARCAQTALDAVRDGCDTQGSSQAMHLAQRLARQLGTAASHQARVTRLRQPQRAAEAA